MPEFVDATVKQIDDRLRELRTEVTRLERARAALTDHSGARGQRAASSARSSGRRRTTSSPRGRRGGNTRANQALELVGSRPGITIPEIAQAMKIQPNYLYRVLPRLATEGQVSREGEGWYLASSSSTSAGAGPAASAPPRRRAGRRTSRSAATRTQSRRGAASGPQRRAASGGTTSAVLAALAGGEALTATEVAAKAGLARPTVSTTLSKLARSGRVQKADRGYRLASAA
jgi:DNA-binding IscR family transcriptional regulator